MEIADLERYLRDKLIALGLLENRLKWYKKDHKTSWLYKKDRRVVVTHLKQKWLGVELGGRWRITDKEGVDRFIEAHVKPMIDELRRQ